MLIILLLKVKFEVALPVLTFIPLPPYPLVPVYLIPSIRFELNVELITPEPMLIPIGLFEGVIILKMLLLLTDAAFKFEVNKPMKPM